MKKLIALILAMLMCFGILAACGTETATDGTANETETTVETEDATETTDNTEETFTFKHGFDLDYPPYSHVDDNGEISGFDVEMAQAVCEYLGWEYEAVPFNWDAKDAELNSYACDCIWSGITVEGREDDYLWTIPYSNNSQMILVPEDSEIKTLDDLAGKIVGVQTATSAYDLLQDGQADLCATFASLEVFETYTIAFNDLQAGAIDAIAIDITSGNYLMSKNEGYKFLDESIGSETYAIAFRKDDTELRDTVQDALLALVDNGTFDEIGQKYPEIYDYLCLGK